MIPQPNFLLKYIYMSMKHLLFAAILLICPTMLMAQTLKSPTLDELMWGGNKYWTLQPENISTAWWGENLVRTGVDTCQLLADARGKAVAGKKAFLFSRAEANAALRSLFPADSYPNFILSFEFFKKIAFFKSILS